MVDTDLKRYLMKRRALENKKLQLKQHFERIDYKIDVVDPLIEEEKLAYTGDTVPVLDFVVAEEA